MGLPAAIKAHSEGNLALAATHYQRALEQRQLRPALFQNYGALLRGNGDLDQAKAVYCQGLRLFPKHIAILRNYANLLRDCDENLLALRYCLQALRLALLKEDKDLEDVFCECINILNEQGSMQWAIAVLHEAFANLGLTTKLLWALFKLIGGDDETVFDSHQTKLVLDEIDECMLELPSIERAEFLFLKAFYFAKQGDIACAIDCIQSAHKLLNESVFKDQSERDKAQKLLDCNSWNASCLFLKAAQFKTAWQLFEWGLRAPASGRQRWQRAVNKLFTHHQVSLWRGESLKESRLLLLEEQAIGDTMMFLTLMPTLMEQAKHIGILVSKRLAPIYQRSFQDWISEGLVSVWSHQDAANGRLHQDQFDYQSPVGSICQYIANRLEDFSPKTPVLIADEPRASVFRTKSSARSNRPLRIGIRWSGGARSDRIKKKSIDAEIMAELMRDHSEDVFFVNLQYGDVRSVVDGWIDQGLPVVNEPSVNPLKDMEEWLNLVASCDAVISVANTTIHGAGGLNIPTMCLLTLHADWRWLNDPEVGRSYWYKSVGIARETDQGGWTPALDRVSQWISDGCPMPDEPVHTDVSVQTHRRVIV